MRGERGVQLLQLLARPSARDRLRRIVPRGFDVPARETDLASDRSPPNMPLFRDALVRRAKGLLPVPVPVVPPQLQHREPTEHRPVADPRCVYATLCDEVGSPVEMTDD